MVRIDQLQARFSGLQPGSSSAPVTGGAGATRFADSLDRALGSGELRGLGAAGFGGLTTGDTTAGAASGSAVVDTALSYQGVPYRWGGESPDGFDCSGLVQHVFARHGVTLPRVAKDQAQAGSPVALSDLQPGDLVFFGSPVDHVGINAGGGKMVAAPHTGDVVKLQSFDPSTVTAARRVLPGNGAGAIGVGAGGGDSSWVDRLPPAGRRFAGAIQQAATAAGVEPRLLAALAWTESGVNPGPVSAAGAARRGATGRVTADGDFAADLDALLDETTGLASGLAVLLGVAPPGAPASPPPANIAAVPTGDDPPGAGAGLTGGPGAARRSDTA